MQGVALHQVQHGGHALDLQRHAGLEAGFGHHGFHAHADGMRTAGDDKVALGQLRQRDGAPHQRAGPGGARRQQVQPLLQHRLQLHRRRGHGVVDHRAIDAALGQPLQRVGGQAFDDAQRGPRKALSEGLHQRRRQRAADAGRQADAEQAGGGTALVFQVLPGALHLLQDATAMGQQARAGRRQRDATAVAVEEGLAQLDLQAAHLAAQRGLRNAQHAGGAGEAAEFGDLHEVFDLLQIHRAMVCRFGLAASLEIALMTGLAKDKNTTP